MEHIRRLLAIRYPFFIALRYLRRGKGAHEPSKQKRFVAFIVAISAGGVALGTATLIVTLAVLAGFEKRLTENIVGYTAHAELRQYGNRPIPDYQSAKDFLHERIPEIVHLAPFTEREVVLRSPRGITGVILRGVSPNDSVTLALRRIKKGAALGNALNDSLPPIIISSGVAKELTTDVGKSLIVFRFHEGMKTREDLLANLQKFRIVGIFETGMSEYDNTVAYTTLDAGQHFLGYSPKQATGMMVLAKDITLARTVSEKLNASLRYPYYALSVYDLYNTIFAWIELQKKPIPIVLGLIILVAAFNIISTLLIIVVEKTHSVGVLRTLGATGARIAQIFITEGLAISVIGVIMGNVVGFGLSFLQSRFEIMKLKSDVYFMSSVPIDIRWEHYLVVSAIAIAISLASTFIPARVASRILPLKALKFG